MLAFQFVAHPAGVTEWVYDDYLTLAVETTGVRTALGPAVTAKASVFLSVPTVEAWTDHGARPQLEDGSANPDYSRSRGYRVRIVITKGGKPAEPYKSKPGTGPLADWVGVYAARVANRVVWKRCARTSVSIVHPVDEPTAEYKIQWWVDSVLARTHTVALPSAETADVTVADGLASTDWQGICPVGTQLGSPYPFTLTQAEKGCPTQGAGAIVASLGRSSAAQALGLPRVPSAPVLVGWQPDCGYCLTLFFADVDRALAVLPPLNAPSDLGPKGRARPVDAPAGYRLPDLAGLGVDGVVWASAGSSIQRMAGGELFADRGILRICALARPVVAYTHCGSLQVDGMALLELAADQIRLWCLSRTAQVSGKPVRAGEYVTWNGQKLTKQDFSLTTMSPTFLRTCFPLPQAATPVPTPAPTERGLTGAIKRAIICEGVDDRNRPVNGGTLFKQGTRSLTLFIEHELPEPGRAEVLARLSRDGRIRSESVMEVAGRGKFVIKFLPRQRASLASGTWLVRIEVDGKLDREIQFTIQ